jgi:hypothetical protein
MEKSLMKYLKIFIIIIFLMFSVSASAEFYKYLKRNGLKFAVISNRKAKTLPSRKLPWKISQNRLPKIRKQILTCQMMNRKALMM